MDGEAGLGFKGLGTVRTLEEPGTLGAATADLRLLVPCLTGGGSLAEEFRHRRWHWHRPLQLCFFRREFEPEA